MSAITNIPTSRIEAFSDGVIAIIITVMIFDLKLTEAVKADQLIHQLSLLFPKFISYAVSFLMLAIMWVNHHQLFHQIRHTDRRLLWYSIHLLFWMSFVPFVTNFIGLNPWLWQASFCYGIVFFMTAFSFSMLRNYVVKKDLLHAHISRESHLRIRNKNRIAFTIYLSASLLSMASVYCSFLLFLIVPAMYVVPEKIIHQPS